MSAGFTTPGLLFLGAVHAGERSFCKPVYEGLAERGYTRFVELCSGALAMSLVAAAAGWKGPQIEASDVSLFSSVLGYYVADRDYGELGMRIDGDLVDPGSGSRAEQAATLLFEQLMARTEVFSHIAYWQGVLTDLTKRRAAHLEKFSTKLERIYEQVGGLSYEPLDLFEHIDRVADDPHTVINCNPPSYCLEVDEPMLTADLRWVRAGDVKVGDELLGFDENTPASGRRWLRRSLVTHSQSVPKECVRVTLEDGTEVVCTTDHPWLVDAGHSGTGRKWVEAAELLTQSTAGPNWKQRYALRLFQQWETGDTFDQVWLAGMYDGEGHLQQRDGSGMVIGLSQKPGPVFDRAKSILTDLGFSPHVQHASGADQLIVSQVGDAARLLGMLRPIRLLSKWVPERPMRLLDRVAITSVEPVGVRLVQSISTSTRTYIGAGFAMHNTSGFEKFYNTNGRLTWDEPTYGIFDPEIHYPVLRERFKDIPALVIHLEEAQDVTREKPQPVYARPMGEKFAYLRSNRPDEIFAINGGPKIFKPKTQGLEKYPAPTIPQDYEIRPDSIIRVVSVNSAVMSYYREMWMHRITSPGTGLSGLLLVDGFVAGVMGYNIAPLSLGARGHESARFDRHAIMRFAIGAPHHHLRLTRLATMVALRKESLEALGSPTSALSISASEGLVTVEYTRHPEAKGLRGIMSLVERKPHPAGHQLIYAADWRDETVQQTLDAYLSREKKWQTR